MKTHYLFTIIFFLFLCWTLFTSLLLQRSLCGFLLHPIHRAGDKSCEASTSEQENIKTNVSSSSWSERKGVTHFDFPSSSFSFLLRSHISFPPISLLFIRSGLHRFHASTLLQSKGPLEAVSLRDSRANLIVVGLGDPHVLESRKRREDRAAYKSWRAPFCRGKQADLFRRC